MDMRRSSPSSWLNTSWAGHSTLPRSSSTLRICIGSIGENRTAPDWAPTISSIGSSPHSICERSSSSWISPTRLRGSFQNSSTTLPTSGLEQT
jgi:hypothetical protein